MSAPDNFQTVLDLLNNWDSLSSSDLEKTIIALTNKKAELQKKEASEKRRREEEEKRLREEEEKRRHEEHVLEVTSMDLPLSWENVFYEDDRAKGLHLNSIPDALIKCLNTLGKVDIEYISAVKGESCKSVITALKGSIYQNPDTWEECFYKGWETADEYLSGNLIRKLKAAKSANKVYKGYFQNNIRAIEKVLPPAVASEDIYITLGSPWVPADIIDDFIKHLYQGCRLQLWFSSIANQEKCLAVKHDELTGSWEIPFKTRYGHCVVDQVTYGTDRLETLHILERTLNMRTIAIKDEIKSPTGDTSHVINKEETVLVLDRQKKLIREFQKGSGKILPERNVCK